MTSKPILFFLRSLLIVALCTKRTNGDVCGNQHQQVRSDNVNTCLDKVNDNLSNDGATRIYKCKSLIRGFSSMINYCPVSVCKDDGTWTEPSLSCGVTECYEKGKSQDFRGRRMCTQSGRFCQRWDSQLPHKHGYKKSDMFSDFSVSAAQAYCRDPDGARGFPWCYTTDPEKISEACDVPECDTEDDVFTCGDTVQYAIQKGMRFLVPGYYHFSCRSLIECASSCSRLDRCRHFTFSEKHAVCELFDYTLPEPKLVPYIKYRYGKKVCK
ncbi:hypothetical protein CHS0354_042483 [Potamilus streckersoni]|uniref:Uncharacterized protein n=2 Tax=Potamilus streckersoni TaxID=2493646 RepID=A0AAE0S9F7_9BIVA|nr:hypothetical protein CHS0354_042483 [Potamilus streckersoni]